MLAFDLRISGIKSNHSANSAATTAQEDLYLICKVEDYSTWAKSL